MLWSIDTCQNKVSTDQYHKTISGTQVYSSVRSDVFSVFFKFLSHQSFVKSRRLWDLINIIISTYLDL